jgi:hypothetical protein
MMNWHIDLLYRIFKKAIFICIQRDEIDNMASLYNARVDFFNDCNKWYSFKPPEYAWLKDNDAYAQLAGQVYFTNKQIEQSLIDIPEGNKICISYETLCQKPRELYDEVLRKLDSCGHKVTKVYEGPQCFECSRASSDKGFDASRAQEAFRALVVNTDKRSI